MSIKERVCTSLTYLGYGTGVIVSPIILSGLVCINNVYITSFINAVYVASYYISGGGSMDVFLTCMARPILESALVYNQPYPSWFRCAVSLAATAAIGVLGWFWCLNDSCERANRDMLIGTFVCSCIYSLSQFWIPTSKKRYAESEKMLMDFVGLQNYTIVNNKPIAHLEVPGTGPPLVLVHGYGQTKACWMETFAELRKHFHIYAIDCPGNGGSTREPFRFKTHTDAELLFCERFEQWRRELGLTNFILLGHSMGGYLSGCYAMRHPEHISQLVLFSPCGMPEPPESLYKEHWPLRWKIIMKLWGTISPQQGVRWGGPLGHWLMWRFYFQRRFPNKPEDWKAVLSVNEYHNAAGPASYENYLFSVLQAGAYSVCALSPRLRDNLILPTGFIYGERDWMTPSCGRETSHALQKKGVMSVFKTVEGVGHQIYWENPRRACDAIVQVVQDLREGRQASFGGSAINVVMI